MPAAPKDPAMTMGRPTLGPELVDRLDGSDQAKLATRTILATLAGRCTIDDASVALDCDRSYVHVLRYRMLEAMVAAAEPRSPGRPPLPASDPVLSDRLFATEKRLKDAEIALEMERLRTEIVQVFGSRLAPKPKKNRRRRR
jgi:hypothetical protein